jgi:ribosomal protein S30
MKEEKKKEEKSNIREQHSGHGSLTKAGKVRSQTPKIAKSNLKKHSGPSKGNRERYYQSLKKVEEQKVKKNERFGV